MHVPEIINHIGGTPLLRIDRLARDLPPDVSVYAKAEFKNPGGSVKDRAGWGIVREGLESGAFDPTKTLLDATSGNTGIAYAMLGAALGFKVKLAIPGNASAPRKKLLSGYGAELVFTDPLEGTDGARTLVAEMAEREPERYFYPDQYNNDANWKAHYDTTGVEILEQTDGAVTHFVAALGTTGTFTGVSRRLKEEGEGLQSVEVRPDTALHAIEGVKHIPSAIVPGIFDASLVDQVIEVSTEEAQAMAACLARLEGLFVGPSSGANVAAALKLASNLEHGVVVTILCDSGERY